MVPQSWKYFYFPCNVMTGVCVCVTVLHPTRGAAAKAGGIRGSGDSVAGWNLEKGIPARHRRPKGSLDLS